MTSISFFTGITAILLSLFCFFIFPPYKKKAQIQQSGFTLYNTAKPLLFRHSTSIILSNRFLKSQEQKIILHCRQNLHLLPALLQLYLLRCYPVQNSLPYRHQCQNLLPPLLPLLPVLPRLHHPNPRPIS